MDFLRQQHLDSCVQLLDRNMDSRKFILASYALKSSWPTQSTQLQATRTFICFTYAAQTSVRVAIFQFSLLQQAKFMVFSKSKPPVFSFNLFRMGSKINSLFFMGFAIASLTGVILNNTVVPVWGYGALFNILGSLAAVSLVLC